MPCSNKHLMPEESRSTTRPKPDATSSMCIGLPSSEMFWYLVIAANASAFRV